MRRTDSSHGDWLAEQRRLQAGARSYGPDAAQRLLGERVGKDIFMYSLILKPQHDTPEVLKHYAAMYEVKPGWQFLTGTPEVMETAPQAGFYRPRSCRGRRHLESHWRRALRQRYAQPLVSLSGFDQAERDRAVCLLAGPGPTLTNPMRSQALGRGCGIRLQSRKNSGILSPSPVWKSPLFRFFPPQVDQPS
jgi:hypothetical protein